MKPTLLGILFLQIFAGAALADAFTEYRRAAALADAGLYDEAIALYSRVIAADSFDRHNLGITFYKRGNAHQANGQYEQAIEDYYEAARLSPTYVYAYLDRGQAYLSLGHIRRAIGDYDFIITLYPTFARAFHDRGRAYKLLGQPDRTARDWETAFGLADGEFISSAQEQLIDKGFYRGPIDGVYGTATREAVLKCAAAPGC